MVLCGCSVSWLVACIGLPPMHSGFDSHLFSWCWCRKWEGPFISCLSYPKSLGGANTGDFKDPTALSEKSRGISLVLVACRSYICTTDLDKFPADEDWATLGNATMYSIVIYYYTQNSMAQNLMDRTINIPKTTSSHQKKSAIQYHQLHHCLFLH